MHIKRYHAADMDEALRQVKQELGADALILSSRKVRRDGALFGRFGRSVVEVVAAVDRQQRAGAPVGPADREPKIEADPSWGGLQLTKSLVDPLESELRSLRRMVEGVQGSHAEAANLRTELRALRRALSTLSERFDGEGQGPALGLRACGLAAEHASAIAAEANQRSDGGEGNAEALARRVLCERLDAALAPPRTDRAGRVRMLVGAPGSGKTTSVAKLGGRDERPAQTLLVSTDVQRLGADAALRGYCREHGLPFRRAASPEDLGRQLGRVDADRVLVDTPGSGPEGSSELRAFRSALGRDGQVDLVVSATTQECDLRAQLERHRALDLGGLVATHFDETRDVSGLVNLILDPTTPPLRWLGTGQRVPVDWTLPEPEMLVERMMGESL